MHRLRDKVFSAVNFKRHFNTPWFKVTQAVVLFLAVYATVVVGILPTQYALEVGQISPETIYAPRTVIDHAATNAARNRAAEQVAPVYLPDSSVEPKIISSVTDVLHYLIELPRPPQGDQQQADETAENGITLEDLARELLQNHPDVGSLDVAMALLAVPLDTLQECAELTENLIRSSMQAGVKADEVDEHVQEISSNIYQAQFPSVLAELIVGRLEDNFTFNLVFSPEETENARRRAMDAVEEIRILKDAKIIDKGELVTEEHLSQLYALGMLHTSVPYGYYLGLAGLVLCIFLSWSYYLYKFRPNIFNRSDRLWLLAMIVLLTLWAAKLFGGMLFDTGAPYLTPASLATLLITIIFDVHLSLFFGATLSVLIAIMAGNELNILVVALIGSIVGAYSVTHVNQRSDLTRAGLLVACANAFAILGIILIGDGFAFTQASLQRTFADVAMGVGGGILASVFAIGLLPFFEMSFGITTSVRLLELANPNQPPLKRLLLEAPGTYHHSILVGNLAEAAAEVVGADPVLARVGAYYHDIGKLARPYFFIENQFQGNNPHDRIPPSLSSMILTAHVRGGVELAEQYRLPPVIKDIIQQHHGDTLIGYFYHRALSERGGKDNLLEEKFRYDGPKPQFKEAGIIMLADSVEAAVRSLAQPNQFRIRGMINRIIQDKLADGQLDHCDLTLKDLTMIAEAFARVMTGIYHKRIAYPTEQDLANAGS
ncbi:MAG TPA: HDIG domain-containing protein [Bacillota bacterium]|nr:HDIG domain-containing protein [Bacillota bacterium]